MENIPIRATPACLKAVHGVEVAMVEGVLAFLESTALPNGWLQISLLLKAGNYQRKFDFYPRLPPPISWPTNPVVTLRTASGGLVAQACYCGHILIAQIPPDVLKEILSASKESPPKQEGEVWPLAANPTVH